MGLRKYKRNTPRKSPTRVEGGYKTKEKNISKYGADYYKIIGSKGGKNSTMRRFRDVPGSARRARLARQRRRKGRVEGWKYDLADLLGLS